MAKLITLYYEPADEIDGAKSTDINVVQDGSSIDFDIGELLEVVSEVGRNVTWSIFPTQEFWILVREDAVDFNYTEFEASVLNNPRGLVVRWERLLEITRHINQTIWCNYIGCNDAKQFDRLIDMFSDEGLKIDRVTPAFIEYVDIAFGAFDGGLWWAYAKDETVMSKIIAAFSHVKIVREW